MTRTDPAPRIRLLGGFEIRLGGVPRALDSARAESLLAQLLLRPGTVVARGRLASLLWPDSTDGQARTNLRKALHTLRARLPGIERHVEVTATALRWRTEEPAWVDVAAFEELLASPDPADRPAALREAVALYGGDLLDGHDDEFLRADRDRLRQAHLGALDELAGLLEEQGDLTGAVAVTERLLRADPVREQAHLRLLRLHAARGDRARALAAFHDCSSTLRRELGVAPGPAVRAAYAALLARDPGGSPPAPDEAGPPRLVGRGPERARLTGAWRAAEAGRAQLVLIGGEPGVGKTRLVDELRTWCARRGAVVADARCYAAEGALAFGPVVAWLRGPALRGRLARLDAHRLGELARLLPELLDETPGLAVPDPAPETHHLLLDAVASAVLAPGAAVLLVVDDLHHGDAETCRFLHYLLRSHPAARLLVVATARTEELDDGHPVRSLLSDLRAGQRSTELELTRLDRAETGVLAERLTGSAPDGADLARLYAETEGNPLFVVEAVRAGRTAGAPASPRVQSVIESRLARLDRPVRELAETAALIGRDFAVDVLAAAADVDEDALVAGLDELWRRRIVRERGADGYDFSHDRIREVAAARVGPARRRQLHRRIAAVLEASVDAAGSGVDGAGPAARIAAHHEQAGAPGRAARWYRRAADAVAPLQAHGPALALLDRALDQVRALPLGRDRDVEELAVQTARLAPLASAGGYAAPALVAAQQRAAELTAALGAHPAPALLRSRAMSASTGGDFTTAREIGAQLQRAGERAGDDVLVVEAAFLLGIAAFWQADLPAAHDHLQRAVARYRPADRRTHLLHYGNDPEVSCLARLGNTLWFLDRPDEARRARAEALARAEEIGHPYSRGIALLFGALLAVDAQEHDLLRTYTAALSEGQESRQLRRCAAALRGLLVALDGDGAAGAAAVRAAVDGLRGDEAPGIGACLLRILLAACVAAGDGDGATSAADRLLSTAGGMVWAAEAHRVRAVSVGRAG